MLGPFPVIRSGRWQCPEHGDTGCEQTGQSYLGIDITNHPAIADLDRVWVSDGGGSEAAERWHPDGDDAIFDVSVTRPVRQRFSVSVDRRRYAAELRDVVESGYLMVCGVDPTDPSRPARIVWWSEGNYFGEAFERWVLRGPTDG